MKKILAGRGAVDYYLNQTRRGLADYYLPEAAGQPDVQERAAGRLSAPGSRWWGGGAEALGLSGTVERGEFVPLFAKGVRPGGGYLGRRFRTQEQAADARAEALARAQQITDPFERWQAAHWLRRSGPQASVAAWDCTFSPTKSVSLLWAAGDHNVQYHVWAAHLAAVDAGLGYLEQHAGYVRAGRNGVRVLETSGLVIARMNEWTSRDGDMHLHTHCLILNRAQTANDGTWRALDGRALLAAKTGASAIYHRVLEAELTRRLQVAWRDRTDGLRELEGVDDELIEAFSTRRRAISRQLEAMREAYRAKYGIDPPPAVVYKMAQDATLATRRAKTSPPDADQALATWEATARSHGRALKAIPRKVVGRAPREPAPSDTRDEIGLVLERLADGGRPSFTRHDLRRAALDILPIGTSTPKQLRDRAEGLVDAVLATGALVDLSAPDPVTVPAPLTRSDGTSIYARPHRRRWTLATTLDREAWLLQVATEPTGRRPDTAPVERAIDTHQLAGDQARAVRDLLGNERRIGLLVGPAGAGKTRTLRTVVDAWQADGGQVVGLTVSQAAADVLADEAHLQTHNTAKWLHETRRGRWRLPERPLLLIDEASMIATVDLAELTAQVRHAGGKVLLVGDPAQLAAIHIGGAFDLLSERHGAAHLEEVRRFTDAWEAEASLQLRRGDPAAIAAYAMRGRLHGGRLAELEDELFAAWRADALGTDDHGTRQRVLMIVTTNEQAAVLGDRARAALLATGAVDEGPTVRLADNLASVGDHIVTRRNDRRLGTTGAGWVVNGDLWTITGVHANGDADVVRHRDEATITLPADYLAAHTHLGYATTAHRAQGMTVDACHAMVAADTSHQQLYVAATRGRHANHLWVALDSERDLITDDTHLPTPEQLLSRCLQRTDPDGLSAHQTHTASGVEMGSLARLGAIFEDAARRATDHWLHHHLTRHGLTPADDDPKWPALLDRARQLALAGHDLDRLLDDAVALGPLDDAHSPAAVLHWRLGELAGHTWPTRRPGPLSSLPPADGPHMQVARQVGELIRQRWRQIRAELAEATGPLPWAPQLGPRPGDPVDARAWLTAATAIAAYRERYDLPGHVDMLGDRPSRVRADAQAAFDHAQHQVDRYLARRLHRLGPRELDDLHARQQRTIESEPPFNPAALQDARRAADQARRAHPHAPPAERPHTDATQSQADALVARLERQAAAHDRWRDQAHRARDILRQIQLARQRRTGRARRR